jgi:hypothetical protein
MKEYGEIYVQIHIFLTSALVGREWSASRPCCFTPGEKTPGTQWIGGWVGPRAGLDDVEKRKFLTLPGLELRLLGRPARSQSLYRLSYPGSKTANKKPKIIMNFVIGIAGIYLCNFGYVIIWNGGCYGNRFSSPKTAATSEAIST